MKVHVLIESRTGSKVSSPKAIQDRPGHSPSRQSRNDGLASLTAGVHIWNDPFALADRCQDIQQGISCFRLQIRVQQRRAAEGVLALPCPPRGAEARDSGSRARK